MSGSRIITFIFLSVFAVGMYVAAGFAWEAGDGLEILAVWAGLFATAALVGVVAGVRSDLREIQEVKEDILAKEKLKNALDQGYEPVGEREEPLNRDDYYHLDKKVERTFLILLPFMILFMALGYFVSPYFLIGAGISCIPLFDGAHRVRAIKRGNVKTVARTFVTDRFVVSGVDSDHHRSYAYYIQVGERKFYVPRALYREFRPGKLVEINFVNKPARFLGIQTHSYFIISKRVVPDHEMTENEKKVKFD